MAHDNLNLANCPRCRTQVAASDSFCSNCHFAEIEDVDYLDVNDQREFSWRIAAQRAAWIEFEQNLRGALRKFGAAWNKDSNWKQIWKELEGKANELGWKRRDTQDRAELWSRPEPDKPPPPPPPPPLDQRIEAIRNWVSELEEAEVNVLAWQSFLDSLPGPVEDELLLESLRDKEIENQFARFEMAQVDTAGNVQSLGEGRIRKVVDDLAPDCKLTLLKIPRGVFSRGSGRYLSERPVRTVSVPEFYLGQFPITQAQWRAVIAFPKVEIDLVDGFSTFVDDNRPVDSVSWPEAIEFCARLSKRTGKTYRLPSEAEWEYACRAGTQTDYAFGGTINPIIVNYDGNHPFGKAPVGIFRGCTVEVGLLGRANRLGLFDMHGNVYEWCADEWHDNYEGSPEDGTAWCSGNGAGYRVVRGGSWAHTAETCRSSDRWQESCDPQTKLHYVSFRVACAL
jgi:formylglycine-generating enzyme required for sulfatase activity